MRIQVVTREFITRRRRMATIILCSLDKDLDLNDKNDLKSHETAFNGLKEKDRFDGSIEKAGKFLKLFGKHLSDCRLKSLLNIAVEWDVSGTNTKLPTKSIDVLNQVMSQKRK